MKFKFRLAAVMRQRKIIEELAQRQFQEANAVLIAEENKLQFMKQQIHESFSKRHETLIQSNGPVSGALQSIYDFQKGQDIRIEKQKAKVQEAEKLVEAKREILRQAVIDYKIIEKLKEKKWEEFKLEYKNAEQKELDEQSVLRFEGGEQE